MLRRTDDELIPPPPKRIKRPRKILDEETYTDGISHIIARDFFPGLLESESQAEYLDALDSNDQEWISRAGHRLAHVMTPQLKAHGRGTSLPSVAGHTPSGYAGETPMSVQSSWPNSSMARSSQEVADKNMSLGAFQAKYTSEDNESFYGLLDKQNEKRAEKYSWMRSGINLPSRQQIKQKEVAENGRLKQFEGVGGANSDLVVAKLNDKPAMPDSWKAKPNNTFMFSPEGVEDSIETVAKMAEAASMAPPKRIVYSSTRLLVETTAVETHIPSSPSLSAIQDAIAGRPQPTASEPGYICNETPRVNGYAFVDEDEPEHEIPILRAPDIILGKGDTVPNPFKIREQSRREDIHHRIVDRVAKNKRAPPHPSLMGRLEKMRTPKFPSSPRVGHEQLTPAAQRLWSNVGRSPSTSSVFDTRNLTPTRPKQTKLRPGWTPN